MLVTKRDGTKKELDLNKIHGVLTWACEGQNDEALTTIKGVSVSEIEMRAQLHFYDGMKTKIIHETLIKAASELISEDSPNYDHVAARLVWFSVRKEAFRNNLVPHLSSIIRKNVESGVYSKDILDLYSEEEINELNSMIDHKRDDLFRYAGAEQMRKKYLAQNRKTKQVFESFQIPYIMVAALLFAQYPKNTKMKYVKKYYDLISQHYISLPTPIMAGLRTKVKQFSSCFPAGQKVWTNVGVKNIENINIGDYVLSDDNTYNRVLATREKIYENNNFIKISSSFPVKNQFVSTDNHPIKTIITSGKRWNRQFSLPTWTQAKDIKIGDLIHIPYIKTIKNELKLNLIDYLIMETENDQLYSLCDDGFIRKISKDKTRQKTLYDTKVLELKNSITMNENIARLLGYFLAEGHLEKSNNSFSFTFSSKETNWHEDVITIVKEEFNIPAIVENKNDNSTKITFYSKVLKDFIFFMVGNGFHYKFINDYIMTLPANIQKHLLIGVIRGDGCIHKNGMTLGMANENLIRQLATISLRNNLYPSLSFTAKEKLQQYKKDKFYVRKSSQKIIQYLPKHDIHTLNMGVAGNKDFLIEVNKNIEKLNLNKRNQPRYSRYIDGEYYSNVLKIEKELKHEEIVYDLQVEKSKSFTVSGVSVHNCTLIESGDSLKSINGAASAIVDYASRKAGIGLNIGSIRAEGQTVRNGDAVTTGVVPFAKYFNAALKSCSQGAVRGASATFNYPIWHLEFERLIELKNNKGTEETRLRTVDYCVHLNKLFYERLAKKENITFFSPDEVPDLYKLFYSDNYKEFERLYKIYEKDTTKAKKTLSAIEVFTKIMNERFETGRIYILNADHVNSHGSFYEPIKMTNLCLTSDTRIVTSNGMKTLGELYISQEAFSVSSDVRAIEGEEQVLKYGTRGEQRFSNKSAEFGIGSFNSSKVFMTNPNAEVFEVKTASGYSVKGTSDHKVMTDSGWKTIGSLNIEDNIYLQSGEGLFNSQLKFESFNYISSNNKWNHYYEQNPFNVPEYATKELGELVGWLVGDGFIDNTKDWTHLVFGNNDYNLIPQFESYIKSLLPNVTISYNTFENSKQMIIQDKRLGLWLQSLGVSKNKSHKKVIPNFIWNSDKDTVTGFLRGLFSADGTVLSSLDNFTIVLNSTSKKLLEEVAILLNNLGIRSSIYLRKEQGFEMLPNAKRKLQSYPVQKMFGLHIGKNNRNTYQEKIGFLLDYKNNNVVSIQQAALQKPRGGSYSERYQDRIVSVQSVGFEPVFDITVDESHSFIANGLVVHNCTEITLPTTPMGNDDSLIALCTLSAINWGKFVPFGSLDMESSVPARQEQKLKDACEMAVRGLDALLDYQDYPVDAAQRHSMRYRPLGVGIIGFAHWLAKGRLYWGEENTLQEVENMMEKMAYYLTETSINLAEEFGSIPVKTKYHDGIFPIDTSILKAKTQMDWNLLRTKAKQFGIRNATLMALMPSETSSQLANETNGIEPPRDMVSIKGSKEGVLPQIVPEYNKLAATYQTLWQTNTESYLKTTAILQKYIDQAISLNTSYDPSKYQDGIKMSDLIKDLMLAYKLGHKTLYYCNTRDGSGDTEDDSCDSGACKI